MLKTYSLSGRAYLLAITLGLIVAIASLDNKIMLILLIIMAIVFTFVIMSKYPTIALVGAIVSLPMFQLLHNELESRGFLTSSMAEVWDRIPLLLVLGTVLFMKHKQRVRLNVSLILYITVTFLYGCLTLLGGHVFEAADGVWIDLMGIVYFVLYRSAGRINPVKVMSAYVVSSSVYGLFGILQAMWGGIAMLKSLGLGLYTNQVPAGWAPSYAWENFIRVINGKVVTRAVSVAGSPLSLANSLVIGLLCAIAMLQICPKKYRVWLLLSILIQSYGLYLTYTRSDMIAALLGILILTHGSAKKNLKRFVYLLIAFVAGVAFIKVHTFIYGNNSISGHVSSYEKIIRSFINNPLGHGVGTVGLAQIHAGVTGGLFAEGWYLQLLFESGVLGLIAYLFFIKAVYNQLNQIENEGKENSVIVTTWKAVLISMSVVSIALPTWTDSITAGMVWGGIGSVVSFKRNSNNYMRSELNGAQSVDYHADIQS